LILAVLLSVNQARAQATNHGRFLRDPSQSGIVDSYGQATPTTFDQDVYCGTVKCGTIKFDYDTYLGKPDPTKGGGGALSGGFYLAPNVTLAPGHTLGWVQTVIATISGASATNFWGITTNNVEYPDATRTSPLYSFTTTAATPPDPPGPPTLGFQDFPSRFFSDGNQTWLAELGLVCFDPTVGGVTEGDVIDTFLWGFGVQTGPDAITANAPHLWGVPTASYLSTLNSFYSGTPPNPPTSGGTSSKYKFNVECDDCFQVPEPASAVPFAVGMMALLGLLGVGGRLRSVPITRG
jgi:hypothetical protein